MIVYNEIEPFCVKWLENLVEAGHIAPGQVEARSIRDLTYFDVKDLTQFHTFAGIGVWSYALRLAGWPDSVPVWSGSCPCQPWSGAGKKGKFDDDRHLWPDWSRLIRLGRPAILFGEQVASKDGLDWLDLVRTDLEDAGYAFGVADLPACGVGAPHKRSRFFFGAVDTYADTDSERLKGLGLLVREWGSRKDLLEIGWGREALDRADANGFAGGEGSPEFGGSDSGSDALAWSGSGGDLLVGSGPDTAGLGLDGRWAGEAGDGRDEARFESDRLREVGDGADATGEPYTESLSGSDGAAHRALRRPEDGSAVARDGVPVDGGDASCSGAGWNAGTDVGAQAQGLGERIAVGSVSDRALFAGAIVDGHHTFGTGPQGLTGDVRVWRGPGWLDPITARSVAQAGATRGFWGDCDWYYCRDGWYRPIGPGLFPLAHGASQRVGRLRAYGNAISPQAALVFIRSFIEALTP